MNSTNRTQSINVKYIHSACIITETPDVKILHDPWFSEGAYDGSWFQFPKLPDPLSSIGDTDIVFISHIHPDHYDVAFLNQYFSTFGEKKIIIANHPHNYLANKMKSDGFAPIILENELHIGKTTINIFPHKTGSIYDVDSAIIIKYDTPDKVHCVVNINDIILDERVGRDIKAQAGEIDILLCGYTGAGPYPQTYFELDDPRLLIEAEKKKLALFEEYKSLTSTLQAKINIPFAGKYLLGGRLSHLNDYRGVADPVEILDFDPHAIVLSDDGGEIDTSSLAPSNSRTHLYKNKEIQSRINEISSRKMDYERLLSQDEIKQLPLKRLLLSAARNAVRRSECDSNYFFCIILPNNEFAVVNANKNSPPEVNCTYDRNTLPEPRSEIIIDARYLFGLLTNVYHWNNGEIGSQFYTRRIPNIFNRKAQLFLNFLTV